MSWERRVLEQIIVSLVEHDKEFGDLARSLGKLGIELNMDGIAYQILTDLTEWPSLPENMEAVHKGELSKENFVEVYLEYMETKFNKPR